MQEVLNSLHAMPSALIDPNKVSLFACLCFCIPVGLVGCAGVLLFLAYAPFAVLIWLVRWLAAASSKRERVGPLVIELDEHEPMLPAGEAARDTLLLVHGFPDSPSMWSSTVDALRRAGYRCLVAALPGARGEPVPTAHAPAELAEALYEALLRHKAGSITLLTHDWGSAYGYHLAQAHPQIIRRMVSLDIGGHLDPLKMPFIALFAIAEYQSVLALVYAMGGPAGSFILHSLLTIWRYPRADQPVTSDMAHHYLGFISSELSGLFSRSLKPLLDYTPKVPTLFAYAAHKPFFFHSTAWLERVRASPGGEVVQMECGHWITHDKPQEWHSLLVRWLDETEAIATPTRGTAD